jgi:DNA-binding FadR family transcriptional regulator
MGKSKAVRDKPKHSADGAGGQQTIVAWAMDKIRELITSGLYKPGDKIPTERDLAGSLKIGRSSIREAIKTFSHLGILESQVPKGTFLCGRSHISATAIMWSIFLGDDDLWDIMELRQIIEEKAFVSMMSRYKQNKDGLRQLLEQLETEVKNMWVAIRENSSEKLSLADYNFHALIIREGGNNLFFSIYDTLHSFVQESNKKTYQIKENLKKVPKDHLEIIKAIRASNTKAVLALYKAHFWHIQGKGYTRELFFHSPARRK